MSRALGILMIFTVLWGWPLWSAAQDAPAGPDAAALEALAAELSDEEKRAALIRRIELLAAAQRDAETVAPEPAPELLVSIMDSLAEFGGDVADSLAFAFNAGVLQQWLEQDFRDPASGAPFWTVLVQALLVLRGAGARELVL
ncbi:MAG: hypothetical protein OXF26_03040, partial [Alphaproteobacteria bacterium]|nr:hypothetical protein [Alphaproteobacteria bacterium]